MMKTFFVETWGCQMNQHDTELIEGELRQHGLAPAAVADQADLVVLNTCSVRDKPVQKIISRIGALTKRNPATTIGVCGCVAEQEAGALLDRSRSVGFVIGPGQTSRIRDAVQAVTQGQRPVFTGFDAEADGESVAGCELRGAVEARRGHGDGERGARRAHHRQGVGAAVAADVDLPQARSRRFESVELKLGAGDAHGAIEELEQAVLHDEKSPYLWVRLGELQLRDANTDQPIGKPFAQGDIRSGMCFSGRSM